MPSGSTIIETVCGTATSMQHLAPAVALLWIAAILTAALFVRGAELVLSVFGITIVAFAIVNFQHLISALGVQFTCP